MAEVCTALPGPGPSHHQQQTTSSTTNTPAQPPPRRPRVREVSSRFMSPIVSSSSSGDLHVASSKHTNTAISTSSTTHHHHHQQRSQSAQRRDTQLTDSSSSYPDENRLETARSLDTPFGSLNKLPIAMQKKHQQHSDGQQLRTLCDNKFPVRSGSFARSRADTPVVHTLNRTMHRTQHSPRSRRVAVASAASTAAAKLVQLSGMSTDGSNDVRGSKCARSLDLQARGGVESPVENPPSSDNSEPKTFTTTDQDNKCSSPVRVQNSKNRPLPDFRSSMPEADLLPTISSKFLAHNRDTPKVSGFPCYRSMNSPLPSCEQQPPAKSVYRPSSSSTCLPPHPSTAKLGIEGRKGTKAANHQEQVHTLRLLYNHHLQWRYANAKAEATRNALSIEAKISFLAVAAQISELHDSVNKKRVELRHLKKERAISTILEAQMPYLDDWSILERDYSTSLGGAIKALQDTSLRLPVIGNVKADIDEVGGALKSASNVMELMSSVVESFLPKGEEMETYISELAEVVNRERALIEECGDLLSRTHMLQVVEGSLRSQLLQLKTNSSLQAKVEK